MQKSSFFIKKSFFLFAFQNSSDIVIEKWKCWSAFSDLNMPPSHPLSGLIRQSEGDFLFLISCETLYTIRTNNKPETFYFFCMNILQGNLKKNTLLFSECSVSSAKIFFFRIRIFKRKSIFFDLKSFRRTLLLLHLQLYRDIFTEFFPTKYADRVID